MFDPSAMLSGVTAPPVDPADIRAVREIQLELRTQHKDSQVAIGLSSLETVCSRGADAGAVWYRSALLEMALQHPEFDRCRRGDEVDETLLEMIAKFPFRAIHVESDGSHQLNLREFYEELCKASEGGSTQAR